MPKKRDYDTEDPMVPPLAADMQVRVGQRIRLVRNMADVSGADLCKQLQCPRSDLSRWENGERLPRVEFMLRFALAYDLSLDFIYMGKPEGVNPALLTVLQAKVLP